jgi:putative SOS response-associated peptidase YedK
MRNTEVWHNIAPMQQVLFVHNDSEGKQTVNEGRWWLVPFWAKEIPKATLFNARIETIEKTPAFRGAFKSRRCLTPLTGSMNGQRPMVARKIRGTSSCQAERPPLLPAYGRTTKSWASPAARSSQHRPRSQ